MGMAVIISLLCPTIPYSQSDVNSTVCIAVGIKSGDIQQLVSFFNTIFVHFQLMLLPLPCYRVRKDLVWQKVLEEKTEETEKSSEADSKKKKK